MASRIREMFSGKEDPVYYHQGLDHSRSSSNNYAYKQQLQRHHGGGPLPIIELRVPMCCEKCKEKVQEELEDMEGVRTVVCDQFNQRVTVAGYADPLRVLKRVKKVKKKSEFFTQGSYIDKSDSHGHHQNPRNHMIHHPVPMHRDSTSVRQMGQALVHTAGGLAAGNTSRAGLQLTRTNSFGRERGLSRQPSFGKVAHYDGLQRHPGHDFESRDLQRDYYGVRRMPSFKKHRYHDAEYVSMGDQFPSAVPQYELETGHYTDVGHHHSQRPVLQSQVSFSKLPVRNPYYVKPVYHEY